MTMAHPTFGWSSMNPAPYVGSFGTELRAPPKVQSVAEGFPGEETLGLYYLVLSFLTLSCGLWYVGVGRYDVNGKINIPTYNVRCSPTRR
jgi:hypothetical protein